MATKARERHRAPETSGLVVRPNADEGNSEPGRRRSLSGAHQEKLPIIHAAENLRTWLDDAEIEGDLVLAERRQRPLVNTGEVVQEPFP